MKDSLLEGKRHTVADITQAQTSVEEARLANKRLQDQGTEWMKKYSLQPEDPSLWPEEFKAKLERGLFCPIDIDDDADRLAPPEINAEYLDFLGELNRGKKAYPPQLLNDMPALAQTFMTPATSTGHNDQSTGMNELTEDAKKVAMLTWAMKYHKGEQRMHAGCWRKVDEVNPPEWALKIKLTLDQLQALERRTHVEGLMEDPMDPVIFTQTEVDDQIAQGIRPPIKDVVGLFWADGPEGKWKRETRTWTLPTLINIYGHRYTFKMIYSAWSQMPIAIPKHRRGDNSATSATATRAANFNLIRKEAKAFVQLHGLEKPQSKEDWATLFREMGRFLATKTFMTNCPAPVMEMPIQPIHDSKEALRFRAVCDERITLPLSAFADHPMVYDKLLQSFHPDSMVDVKVNWRCNVQHTWAAEVTPEQAWPIYLKLGYKEQELLNMGLKPPPTGAAGPEGGGDTTGTTELMEDRKGFTYPMLTEANVLSVASGDYKKKNFGGKQAHVFWAQVECGLVLPSVSSWEVVTKEKGITRGGYMCRYCKGFWSHGRGGTRFLQILGRHRGHTTALQMVLDEPPEQLYNQWLRDRIAFYKRVEPLAAPRDERLTLVGGRANRIRFSSTNGLGPVSDAIWAVILKNEEINGLKVIQEVARTAAVRGEA